MERLSEKLHPTVEITSDGGLAKIVVGGVELKNRISEYRLTHKAGEAPKLELIFTGVELSVTANNTHIIIPPEIKSFFKKYGE